MKDCKKLIILAMVLAISTLIISISILMLAVSSLSSIQEYLIAETRSIREGVARELAENIPVKGIDYIDGKDGADGRDGVKGVAGRDGKSGLDGIDGANGTSVSIIQKITEANGDTVLIFSDKTELRVKAGRDGERGEDGNNGKSLEIRCYTDFNQLEQRYIGDDNWQVITDEHGNPTPCLSN